MKEWTKLVEYLDTDVDMNKESEDSSEKEELTESWSYDPKYQIIDSLETIGDVLRNLIYMNKNHNRIAGELWFIHEQFFTLFNDSKLMSKLNQRFGFMEEKISSTLKSLDAEAIKMGKEIMTTSPNNIQRLESYLHEIDSFINMINELPDDKKNNYVNESKKGKKKSLKKKKVLKESSADAAFNAVMRRIENSHPEIMAKFRDDEIEDAVKDVTSHLVNLDEIGSSDVSIWTKQAVEELENIPWSGVTERLERKTKVFDYIRAAYGEWFDDNIISEEDSKKLKNIIAKIVETSNTTRTEELATTSMIAYKNMPHLKEDFPGISNDIDPVKGLADALDTESDDNKTFEQVIREYLTKNKLDIVPLNGIVDKSGEI